MKRNQDTTPKLSAFVYDLQEQAAEALDEYLRDLGAPDEVIGWLDLVRVWDIEAGATETPDDSVRTMATKLDLISQFSSAIAWCATQKDQREACTVTGPDELADEDRFAQPEEDAADEDEDGDRGTHNSYGRLGWDPDDPHGDDNGRLSKW